LVSDTVAIIAIRTAADHDRPRGAAFGALVHAVLSEIPFGAAPDEVEQLAHIHARVLGIEGDDVPAAADTVRRVLRHDLLRRAAAADARGACRRETPVTLTLSDGRLLEGIVDLAFEENGAWIVLDYKTDADLAAADIDAYRQQVAVYTSAVAEATGQPASGVIVHI
jgi:ATP-dependent exoDNAse (exonuclease V) beta subunit